LKTVADWTAALWWLLNPIQTNIKSIKT
jgi:hypothetical protein